MEMLVWLHYREEVSMAAWLGHVFRKACQEAGIPDDRNHWTEMACLDAFREVRHLCQ